MLDGDANISPVQDLQQRPGDIVAIEKKLVMMNKKKKIAQGSFIS